MKKRWMALLLSLSLLCTLAPLSLASEQTTTIMMYMCGSDLQDSCLEDLEEMCSVSLPDSVNIVVEAGGAAEWDDRRLKTNALNRFTITNQGFSKITTVKNQSMGAQETLYDFLRYAAGNYPADRMILILWDHGDSAADGVCYDENYDNDFLTIHEIYGALSDYQSADTDFHLDVIGFDACLMASYEIAAHLMPFADYMVASEEMEPGTGWDYGYWLKALAKNPAVDNETLCKAIADGFYQSCYAYFPEEWFTMSVTNLTKMQPVVDGMEEFAEYLSQALDNGQLATLSRARQRMMAFGDYDDSSSDMVDLNAFLSAYSQFAPNTAQSILQAYQSASTYSVYTKHYTDLAGLSILLPYTNKDLVLQSFDNYECTERIQNYSAFVRAYTEQLCGGNYVFSVEKPTAQSGAQAQAGGLFSGLSTSVYVPVGSYVAPEDGPSSPASTAAPNTGAPTFDFGTSIYGGTSPAQTQTPEALPVYAYSTMLSKADMQYLSYAEGLLFLDGSDDEDEFYIGLGALKNAGINWETGEIVSLFDGEWPMLEDQLVVMYDQMKSNEMRRSIIPVTLNGLSGYLSVSFTGAYPDGIIVGFTEGYDAQGLPVRGLTRLKTGDVIIPTYPLLYVDENGDMQEDSFEGDPITKTDAELSFGFESLEGSESNYLYCFRLVDIFGETQLSEMIQFGL